MGLRQKIWGKKKRLELLEILGNKCAECGATNNLQFDVIIAAGHSHHRMSQPGQMCFYRRQHKVKNLQILCATCNGRKGLYERYRELEANPF